MPRSTVAISAAATATIGPIFPPSIPLIIFAAVAEVSGVKLLIAGVVPALVIVAMFMITIAVLARIQNDLFDLGGEQRLEKLGIHCFSLVPFPGH